MHLLAHNTTFVAIVAQHKTYVNLITLTLMYILFVIFLFALDLSGDDKLELIKIGRRLRDIKSCPEVYMKIRFISFNIQHCRDHLRSRAEGRDIIDFDLIASAIKSQDPDIVVLNEVRNKGSNPDYTDQAKKLAEKAGCKYYRFGEAIRFLPDLPYGNALLSNHPIEEFEVIKIPDPPVKDEDAYYESRAIMRAKIKVGEKFITVFGTHMGLANSEQKNAVETVVSLLDKCDQPHVLMGDFNMQPDNEKLKPIYARLIDTAQYFAQPKLSFPSDNPSIKIDYIFVSNELKVTYADIPDIVASDHRMVVADIEL